MLLPRHICYNYLQYTGFIRNFMSEKCKAAKIQASNLQLQSDVVTKCDHLTNRIVTMRNNCVMIDRDLADLYKVTTKALNQAIKRNIDRFPERFRFRLSDEEKNEVVTNCDHLAMLKFSHAPVYAFTEQGVAMLATVLKSEVAVQTSIDIMDAFVAMRRFMMSSAGVLQRLGAIEIRQIESEQNTERKFDTVFAALERGNLLPSGILQPGAEYDGLRLVTRMVESAKSEIVLIDPYADSIALDILAHKRRGVKVTLLCKREHWTKPTDIEVAKFNKQYGGLVVKRTDKFHDRFVIIDGIEMLNLGSSINHLGSRLTSYSTRNIDEIADVMRSL